MLEQQTRLDRDEGKLGRWGFHRRDRKKYPAAVDPHTASCPGELVSTVLRGRDVMKVAALWTIGSSIRLCYGYKP